MGILFYIVFFILNLINFSIYLYQNKLNSNSIYTFIYLILSFSAFGFMEIALSKNVEEALLATKIAYLGGQFLPPILLILLTNLVNLKHQKIIAISCMVIALSYFAITTIFIGNSDLYYQNVEFYTENGVSYLVKDYGKLYIISKIYIIFFLVLMVSLIIFAVKHLKRFSYKNLILLSSIFIVTTVFSLFSKAFSKSIDLMPCAYFISGLISIFLIRRINIYNLNYISKLQFENEENHGFMGFDNKRNFLGATKLAFELFPMLNDIKIDLVLPQNEDFKILNDLMDNYVGGKYSYRHIQKNNETYRVSISNIVFNNKKYGYFLEITNDTKQIEYIRLLNNYKEELSNEVDFKTKHIQNIQDKLVLGMADIIESRDESTGGHVRRTSSIIEIITNTLKANNVYNKSDEFYDYVRRLAPLHDLGKVTISNEILNKPGKYTDEEFNIMKTHSEMGEKMVSALLNGIDNNDFLTIAKNIAKYHHEKYCGGGYPLGLKGEIIPIEARIMALADVYDALVSKRCYKEKMGFEAARNIILESMGSHFDPKLEPIFRQCVDKIEDFYKNND